VIPTTVEGLKTPKRSPRLLANHQQQQQLSSIYILSKPMVSNHKLNDVSLQNIENIKQTETICTKIVSNTNNRCQLRSRTSSTESHSVDSTEFIRVPGKETQLST